jgi:hypothetical protein
MKTMFANHVAVLKMEKSLVITFEILVSIKKNQFANTVKLLKSILLKMDVVSLTVAINHNVLNTFQTSKLNALNLSSQLAPPKVKNSSKSKTSVTITTMNVAALNSNANATNLSALTIHQFAHQDNPTKSPEKLVNVVLPTLLNASIFHASKNAIPPLLATTLVL